MEVMSYISRGGTMRFGHFFYRMNIEGYVLDAVGESGRKRMPSEV